jgi:hypothetical protein
MRNVVALVALAALADPGYGQEAADPQTRPSDDEITVIGRQSLRSLWQEVERAQDDIYTLFNALNEEDRYDITCKREQLLGTLIRQRLCMPNHVRQGYSRSASLSVLDGIAYDPRPAMANDNRILAEKMAALIDANPQLRQAVENYARLLDAYILANTEKKSDD